ncbi:MAG TPA: ABC transporter ATP-binding protein [Candidatus Hydrogenedentes bacterium]|nr:ABC transporter ATP-binding protein [Candidatus Hydrogenedentota bacterium]HOV74018.1 ABC transporter ATP-binding protein [Candidatus Hydrogenedentota bacterium]HPC15996.1 ABC transporter ATP-binding protein [Candidatus Hydrogenedentota bacterium]HRT64628.1 ABC transporter ATP-binding protein [Candidatus Hydrogenedentota bacterium]
MIQIDRVSKMYAGRGDAVTALDGVSLQAHAGEFVAVQGPSGCGKTTLLLVAGGLLAPTSGKVVVNGREPYALSPEDRARFRAATIGFVFQQFHLVPYLSVEDNILIPSMAASSGDARARARALMDRFQLSRRARHVPAELSTGERQRVALARALLNHPKALLADEPTGNLDEENAGIVLAHLTEFAREGGTVLLVTHDARAARHACRTIHLRSGCIVSNPEDVDAGDDADAQPSAG